MESCSSNVLLTDQRLAVAHERRPNDARIEQLPPDIDLHELARIARHACEPDRTLQRRREGAARDRARLELRGNDGLMRPQHAALEQQQSHELALGAPRSDAIERAAADEVALGGIERDGPAEIG